MDRQIIHIHAEAPTKPPEGQPCNGCGVCCLAEPCPVGMLVSRRRHGACVALRWDEDRHLYRCGMLVAPLEVLARGSAARRPPGRLSRWAARGLARLCGRWISAGSGCDCDLQPMQTPAGGTARSG